MYKQIVVFAVETNKKGIVTRVGRSVIQQPQVIKKSSPVAAERR